MLHRCRHTTTRLGEDVFLHRKQRDALEIKIGSVYGGKMIHTWGHCNASLNKRISYHCLRQQLRVIRSRYLQNEQPRQKQTQTASSAVSPSSPCRHHTVHFNSICLLFSSHGLSLSCCHSFFAFFFFPFLTFSLSPMSLSFCILILLHVSPLHRGGTKTMTERGGWVVEITC